MMDAINAARFRAQCSGITLTATRIQAWPSSSHLEDNLAAHEAVEVGGGGQSVQDGTAVQQEHT